MPDADMLQRLSEVLEVTVSRLLGEQQDMEQGRNEIAEQLARINEQLAVRNRRSKRIWTALGLALGTVLVVLGTVLVLNLAPSEAVLTFTEAEVSGKYQVLEDQNGNRIVIHGLEELELTVEKAEE